MSCAKHKQGLPRPVSRLYGGTSWSLTWSESSIAADLFRAGLMFKRFQRSPRTARASPQPAPAKTSIRVRHQIHWREGAIHWAEELGGPPLAEGFAPLPCEVGRLYSFSFVAPASKLDTVLVRLGTYMRPNIGRLEADLRDRAGQMLARSSLDISTIRDNEFTSVLDLGERATLEIGSTYEVVLALKAEPGNEIAVFALQPSASEVSAVRRIDGFAAGEDLVCETPFSGPLPHYRLDWDEDDVHWSVWPSMAPSDAEPPEVVGLNPGRPFEFDIIAPAPRCKALWLEFLERDTRAQAFVVTEVRELAGKLLYRSSYDLSGAGRTPFLKLADFAGARFVPGRKYRVRLLRVGEGAAKVAIQARAVSLGRYELRRHLEAFPEDRTFADGHWRKPISRPVTQAVVCAPMHKTGEFGSFMALVGRSFPGLDLHLIGIDEVIDNIAGLRDADVVIFADQFDIVAARGVNYDHLCFDLHRHGVCTIFFDSTGASAVARDAIGLSRATRSNVGFRQRQATRCHFMMSPGRPPNLQPSVPGLALSAPLVSVATGLGPEELAVLVAAVRAPARPRVAVVAVLHRKSEIIESFLDHIRDQSYPGDITTVLVDDISPEDDAQRALRHAGRFGAGDHANRHIRILANAENLGNCGSRLAGLAAIEAEIYIVIDCDCLINRDFVAAHVFEHWWSDVDAVTGPTNIESNGRDAAALLSCLDSDPVLLRAEMRLQDPILPEAFVNCITRNFSVKRRRILEEPLFDPDFAYSAKPDSGFGWEDVEMGFRLYAKGAVIRFTDKAFAVHCSHASSISEERKILGSTRNFARLFEKHPDLSLVARRWATDTYDRIVRWQEQNGVASGPDRKKLDGLFAGPRAAVSDLLPRLRGERKPLRILTYRWHVPHQYELYKLPHSFTLLTQLNSPATDQWSYDQRPLRPNARLVPYTHVDERDFDVALLHFDEAVLAAHLCNGVIPATWGDSFRHFLGIERLPKVAVCHGTVPFVGQFGLDPGRKHIFETHEEERLALVEALAAADVKVVCNSHQAEREWGFVDSRVVWHGFDPQEFPPGTLERDVLALEADHSRPHYRGAWEHAEVLAQLDPGIRVETAAHGGAPIEDRSKNPYAVRNFRSYIDRIRSFKFYLNTTLRSPMPRSRGEAMMTGVIPVSLRNHDVDLFIENGVDGFYADTPAQLADFINAAMKDPSRVRAMSRAARLKALDVFNHDRYLAAWNKLLLETA